ncbi:MAG: cell division protein SepF [Clostridia bacterium]|nr:cell division protein SepF [Clostridia bacterium]
MSNFMPKMLNFLGFDTEEGYEEDYYVEESRKSVPDFDDIPVMDRLASRRSSRVVKLHESNSQQMRVVVLQPESFEEAKDITDHLKERKPIIVNLESVEREIARRIVDFLGGAVYALDGDMQKITNGIFLIAPHNVGILAEELVSGKNGFSWGN